jgi:DNA-binding response OmpR family regulator
MAKVLIIEDDRRIRELIARVLSAEGHDVDSVAAAMAGLQHVVDDGPDVVILDLGLPDLDGVELLRMIRAISAVPVIVATARGDDGEIVGTLDAGADDYLVKPFSGEQLKARVRAVLRRTAGGPEEGPILVGALRIDVAARVATLDGQDLDLSPKEFELLAFMAGRPDTVLSKRELMAEVWRQPYGGGEKTVDVHLSWLRRKLGETAAEPRFIRTVHGVGVKLVDPDR